MKKKVIILFIVFSLGFSVPLYVSHGGVPIIDTAQFTKEFGLDTIARVLARTFLSRLSNATVRAINQLGVEGGQPSTTFVRNFKKFLADAQVVGENQFRTQLNYAANKGILCDDLKGPLALIFQTANVPYLDIGNPKISTELKQNTLLPYQNKIKCTIPDDMRKKFNKDFQKGGGWETWSRMLEPQNNLAGTLSLSLTELQKQRGSQASSRINEMVAGSGFIGVQDSCRDDIVKAGTAGGVPLTYAQGGRASKCNFLGEVVTPSKILGESAAGFLDNNSKWLVSSDELSEVIIDLVTAATNKLINFTTGAARDAFTKDTTPANYRDSDYQPESQDSGYNIEGELAEAGARGEEYRDRSENIEQDMSETAENTEETVENTEAIEQNTEDLGAAAPTPVPTPIPTPTPTPTPTTTTPTPSPTPTPTPSFPTPSLSIQPGSINIGPSSTATLTVSGGAAGSAVELWYRRFSNITGVLLLDWTNGGIMCTTDTATATAGGCSKTYTGFDSSAEGTWEYYVYVPSSWSGGAQSNVAVLRIF